MIKTITLIIAFFFLSVSVVSSTLHVDDDIAYDDVNDITWLLDANYIVTSGEEDEPGYVTWNEATEWVETLTVGGGVDWRLPADDEMTYGYVNNGELGYLYYDNLGNVANERDFNSGVFINVQRYSYWTSSTATTNPNERWTFNFYHGATDVIDKRAARAVWPVHSGDVRILTWQGEALTWQGVRLSW